MSAESQHFAPNINSQYKRILLYVIAINASMFVLEMLVGFSAHSQALKADALDFFIDAFSYSISFWALDKCQSTRNNIAKLKAFSMIALGLWILIMCAQNILSHTVPDATAMSGMSILALLANMLCVVLLLKYKKGDANIRSVWLCSRNDMINNILIIIAGVIVFITGSKIPDILVALFMSGLFVYGGIQVLRQSLSE